MQPNKFFWENEYISIELIDGILFCSYKGKLEINLEIAQKVAEFRLKVTENKSYPCIIFPNEVKYIDKEARNYFFTQKGIEGLEAIAIMGNDVVAKIILNFIIVYTHPIKPTKMFTTLEDALKWLEQYKKASK